MSVNPTQRLITAEEFEKLCSDHDWHYAYSDDHRVWTRGEAQRAVIQQHLARQPELAETYKSWLVRIYGN